MDLSHIFYKQIPTDGNNIFLLTLHENNETEEVLLIKDQNYKVTGLSISQKSEVHVIIPDLNVRHSYNNMIRSYKEEGQKINVDCHFFKKDLFDTTIPFKKRSGVLTTG